MPRLGRSYVKRSLITPLLLLLMAAQQWPAQALRPADLECESEMQVVMCGQIPFKKYRERFMCCNLHKPLPPEVRAAAEAHAAAQVAAAATAATESVVQTGGDNDAQVIRPDLHIHDELAEKPQYYFDSCTSELQVDMPAFFQVPSETPPAGPEQPNKNSTLVTMSAGGRLADVETSEDAFTTGYELQQQSVPDLSSRILVNRVKAAARAKLPKEVQQAHDALISINPSSGFIHPADCAGPAELALMQHRLSSQQPTQTAALNSLLTGAGVPPKIYAGGWFPPTGCPAEGYTGPYPMPKFSARWGGMNNNAGTCAENYPAEAPQDNCAHVSWVELDANMSYKQALAFWATGDVRYADNAQKIMEGWPKVNVEWGLQYENGPLEAGWGCAATARAMELLKHSNWTGFSTETYSGFVNWVNTILMPQMDTYVYKMSAAWVANGAQHVYGNWHSTIAECFVAFGLLTDDRDRYQKGIELYHTTVQDYLKWGRGEWKEGRIVGEMSETMRDIYHSEFGLGGLVQVAEMAWQQDEDLYSSNGHALASAIELHARLVLAKDYPALLPPGFKFYEDMPKPPKGTTWRFNIRTQRWHAQDKTTGDVVATLEDGVKYLLGITFLPTGFEHAYNHYVGRLGMHMPNTAQLLAKYQPEWFAFHWGLGTLTHANTAAELWRPGLDASTLCDGKHITAPKPGGPDPDSWWIGVVPDNP